MSRLYQTAIEIGARISKTFKSETIGAATALSKLTAETKKLREAEKAAAAYKKLDDAVKRSKTKYDQASAALRKLEEAEKAAGGATKESTVWRKAGERAVAAAAREMDRGTKSAEKNAAALRQMGVDTANLVREQNRLAGASKFAAARDRLFGKPSKEKTPLVQKAGQQFSSVARDVAILGTAAVGTGAAMAALVIRTLKAGDEIGDTADKLGIGAKALQELRYGAEQSGAEVGAVDIAIRKMAVSVGHFQAMKGKGGGGPLAIPGLQSLDQAGGGAAAAAVNPFKTIGLDAKKLAGLKPEEQTQEDRRRASEAEDP
jgi:hypothetical protein